MIKESKERLQITVSKELAGKIRKYCDMTGVSVSGLCAVAIAEKLLQYEKAFEIVDKYAGVALVEALKESKEKKDE